MFFRTEGFWYIFYVIFLDFSIMKFQCVMGLTSMCMMMLLSTSNCYSFGSSALRVLPMRGFGGKLYLRTYIDVNLYCMRYKYINAVTYFLLYRTEYGSYYWKSSHDRKGTKFCERKDLQAPPWIYTAIHISTAIFYQNETGWQYREICSIKK